MNEGDIVGFKYSGGSTPGEYRYVRVTSYTKDKISGMDLKVGEPRTYSRNKISLFECLAGNGGELYFPFQVVAKPDGVDPVTLVNIFKMLNQDVTSCHWNANHNVILAYRKVDSKLQVFIEGNKVGIQFTNTDSKSLIFNFNGSSDYSCKLKDDEVVNMIHDLVTLFKGLLGGSTEEIIRKRLFST